MAKITAIASGGKRNLAVPLRKKIGTKTMQMQSVETNAGTAICDAPSRIARTIGFFIARLRWMFSISTVASSTKMPTARASPPNVIRFMVWPSALRMMIEHKIDNGIEVAVAVFLSSGREDDVLGIECGAHICGGKSFAEKLLRIDINHDLARLAAVWQRDLRTLHGGELRADEIQTKIIELLLRKCLTG